MNVIIETKRAPFGIRAIAMRGLPSVPPVDPAVGAVPEALLLLEAMQQLDPSRKNQGSPVPHAASSELEAECGPQRSKRSSSVPSKRIVLPTSVHNLTANSE